MGRSQREKGARFERAVANRMKEIFPDGDVHRGLQSAGARESDVQCPVYWIETKHGIKPNPRAALAQAIGDSEGTGKVPVAVVKDNQKEPFVVMRLEDWLAMAKEAL